MPPSSSRPPATPGRTGVAVLVGEMFLTTSLAHAGPAVPDATATSPCGQFPTDMAPGPAEPAAPVGGPQAAPPTPEPRPPGKRPPPDPDTPAAPPRLGAGGEVRIHGGIHAPVVGAAIAFDWAWRRASVGVGVDYAAWIEPATLRVSPGALHVFGLAVHRVPLGRVNLRQRLGVGPAIALERVGVDSAGKTGLFFEVAPLGLEVQTRVRRLAVALDAFSLAISAPVLGKDVFAVIQYRVALGLRF